jgi:hypothetical protein
MLRDSVRAMLLRDLATMRREIESYPDDETPWATPPGIANPGGTLALHVAGNLQHFVGALLGGTGYVRDRPAEFERRGVPRAELCRELDAAARVVRDVLAALPDGRLAEPMRIVPDLEISAGIFLLHLSTHLTYHLGQMDYHRRLLSGAAGTVDALGISGLPSAAAVDPSPGLHR